MTTAIPPAPPPATSWPGAGIVLSGRFRLLHCVAAGGTTVVWRAHDEHLDRDVAIKLLLPHRQADPVARGRFEVEGLATVRAKHPNAVRVYDAAMQDDMSYLVMEFVEGCGLDRLPRPLRPVEAAAVGAQVAGALAAAHQRDLVHRDVKPANVLLDSTGRVKLVDFGIAKLLDEGRDLTRDDLGVGTARYLAPEQLTGRAVGPWTDVYCLGLTLWELVAGRPAFSGEHVGLVARARLDGEVPGLSAAAPDVHDDLAATVDGMTRRDPRARTSPTEAIVNALQAICGPRPHEVTRSLVAVS